MRLFVLKVLKVTIVLIFSESRFAKRSYEELANVAKELKKSHAVDCQNGEF